MRLIYLVRIDPLFGFRRPPGFYPDDASRRSLDCGPFLGLSRPVGTCVRKRSGHPRALPARHRPSAGFLATLSTVCSLSRLVRPVAGRQRRWGSPFGAFSSPRLPGVLRRCRPACRSPQASLRQTRDLPKLGPVARLPGASSGESLAAATSLTPPCRRLLPWVSSLSRVHFACLGRPFRRLILSRACRPPRLLASGLPCATESQSADDLPGPKAEHPSQGFAPHAPWR